MGAGGFGLGIKHKGCMERIIFKAHYYNMDVFTSITNETN